MSVERDVSGAIAAQKLLALALIGYLSAMRDHGYQETDINYIFQPIPATNRMNQLGVDASLIDACYQLDEVEALSESDERARAIDNLVRPIIQFLRKTKAPNNGAEAAIFRLLD